MVKAVINNNLWILDVNFIFLNLCINATNTYSIIGSTSHNKFITFVIIWYQWIKFEFLLTLVFGYIHLIFCRIVRINVYDLSFGFGKYLFRRYAAIFLWLYWVIFLLLGRRFFLASSNCAFWLICCFTFGTTFFWSFKED